MIEAFLVGLAVTGGPLANELDHLPTQEVARANMEANRKFRMWVEDVSRWTQPADEWVIGDVLRETDALYNVWDWIYWTQNRYCSLAVRLDAADTVRGLIGEPAYLSGDWPPAFPWWRVPRTR